MKARWEEKMTGEEVNKVIFLSEWGLLILLTVRRRRFNAEKERAQGKFIKAGQERHCAGREGRAFFLL